MVQLKLPILLLVVILNRVLWTHANSIFARSWTRSGYGIVFVISSSFNSWEAARIRSAAQELEKHSCFPIRVQTQWDTVTVPHYVFITGYRNNGCYATVGMQGGRQTMNLDPIGCTSQGTILHEMMHSLGYEHEHNRHDRDRFVQVHYNNVELDRRGEFAIKRAAHPVGSYDFASILHYHCTAFAKNERFATISSKVNGMSVPCYEKQLLSSGDKAKIRAITGCKN